MSADVLVKQPMSRHHLGGHQAGPVGLQMAPVGAVGETGHRAEDDPVGDPHPTDSERMCERRGHQEADLPHALTNILRLVPLVDDLQPAQSEQRVEHIEGGRMLEDERGQSSRSHRGGYPPNSLRMCPTTPST